MSLNGELSCAGRVVNEGGGCASGKCWLSNERAALITAALRPPSVLILIRCHHLSPFQVILTRLSTFFLLGIRSSVPFTLTAFSRTSCKYRAEPDFQGPSNPSHTLPLTAGGQIFARPFFFYNPKASLPPPEFWDIPTDRQPSLRSTPWPLLQVKVSQSTQRTKKPCVFTANSSMRPKSPNQDAQIQKTNRVPLSIVSITKDGRTRQYSGP